MTAYVQPPGGSNPGGISHNALADRSAADVHPASSITGFAASAVAAGQAVGFLRGHIGPVAPNEADFDFWIDTN